MQLSLIGPLFQYQYTAILRFPNLRSSLREQYFNVFFSLTTLLRSTQSIVDPIRPQKNVQNLNMLSKLV